MTGWKVENPGPKPRTRPHAKRLASTGGQFTIRDELWALMEPLLAPPPNTRRFGGGRPRVPDRVCAEGIFFVWRTGGQWNALPATGICPGSTAHDRLQARAEDGLFLRFWQAGLAGYDAFHGLGWSGRSMDGALTKAPLAGGKTRARPHRPRQGGHQTLAPGGGSGAPIGLCVAGANKNDCKMFAETIWSLPVDRPVPTPEAAPHPCLDKGGDDEQVRWLAEALGCVAHIRSRGEETTEKKAGRKARRRPVERTRPWMNRLRSLLTRRARKAQNHLAMLHFVCGLISYRASGLFG